MNVRALPAISKGIVRRTLPASLLRAVRRNEGTETLSARYCYAVWMRHLVKAAEGGQSTAWESVAELGPGGSLGVGIAALLTGADRYIALDVVRRARPAGNLVVFDELVQLLRRQTPIPGPAEFPEVRPGLADYAFPAGILDHDRLEAALNPDRVAALRQAVDNGSIRYVVPWDDPVVIEGGTVDLVISQAVMEHVGDLEHTYRAMAAWLKPGGLASHQIDLRSHGTHPEWNGHWAYPDWLWRMAFGDRINRLPRSRHVAAIEAAGLVPLVLEPSDAHGGLRRDQLAAEWQRMDDGDLTCPGLFVQAFRPN